MTRLKQLGKPRLPLATYDLSLSSVVALLLGHCGEFLWVLLFPHGRCSDQIVRWLVLALSVRRLQVLAIFPGLI
jgi:hypothetical protein